jgi:hypothetical protein
VIEKDLPRLPRWLGPANQVIKMLQELGIAFFSFHVLAVPGRRTGRLRATPVSPFTVDGRQYILSFGRTDWVKNARKAGWGVLSRGRRHMRVALVEVHAPDARPIVREFPRRVPAGVQFFVRLGLVQPPGSPDQFEAASENLALFRIDRFRDAEGPPAEPRT